MSSAKAERAEQTQQGENSVSRGQREQRPGPARGPAEPRILSFTLTSLGNTSSNIKLMFQDDFSAAVQTEEWLGGEVTHLDVGRSMRRRPQHPIEVTWTGMATMGWRLMH